jgi:hypothetical protein
VKKLSPDAPPDSSEAVAARLEEMERKVERLRTLYETFFSGAERRPPNVPRREMNRLMLEMQQLQIRNAALRFRFQSLQQKWILYTTYWNRTLREIESGTYRKDLARVQRKLALKGSPLTEEEAVALGIPATRARALIARQGSRAPASQAATADAPIPAPLPARAAFDPSESVAGMSAEEVDALHRRYAEARRQAGAAQPTPTLATFRELLQRKAPKILQEHGAARLVFDVALKEGKVVLKAKPVK